MRAEPARNSPSMGLFGGAHPDLARALDLDPVTTFYLRIQASVPDLDIREGDLLIVDRSAEPRTPVDLVIYVEGGALMLGAFGAIEDLEPWGVVTHTIREVGKGGGDAKRS